MRPFGSSPNLSKRQAKMLKNGLQRCGLRSYRRYLLSDYWRATRERYRASRLPQGCWVCRAPNVDLHHRTYARLGNEKVSDLVPLCREHHDQLHEEGLDLWDGPSILCRREREARARRPRPGDADATPTRCRF